jgi:phosphomannomutase
MLVDAETVQRAQEWSRKDPNETTASYVQNLIQTSAASAESASELKALFPQGQRIGFGTAGLRSAMKPGPLGMNDLVVLQTAQGLARYIKQQVLPEQQQDQKPSVVVGYDHRENSVMNLSSLSFAVLTALVFIEAGFDCFLLDGFVATPLVPYTLTQIKDCTCGIMITASHNPKQDAGYKVYWSDGCQIRSPLDKEIANSILQPSNLQPWVDYRQVLRDLSAVNDASVDPCLGLGRPEQTKEMIASYFQAIQDSGLVRGQAKLTQSNKDWKPPSFCYTAMHGVGHRFARQAFETFGIDAPFHSVPTQQEPDPAFPTVPFPNPEEKGALDAAKAHAVVTCSDVVLANDPDADRLAVAEKSRLTGEWTTFTGDEIGTMLGHWLWQQDIDKQQHAATGVADTPPQLPLAMCASTVSSKMLAEIARVEGFYFEDTLTGFKWIGSRAAELHRSGKYRSIFCYEEAIGFCCGNLVFDKDGISALGVFCDLTMSVYNSGKSLKDHMQSLYDKYGEFVSQNGYFFLKDPSVVATIMDKMTTQGTFSQLATVGPYKVESFRYLGEPGYDSTTADKKPTLPTDKASPMMTIRFENGCVAQFRASGTEPKFKYYIELKGKPGVSREVVTEDLAIMSAILLETLLQPEKHGLVSKL